jgi:hypothetical protein
MIRKLGIAAALAVAATAMTVPAAVAYPHHYDYKTFNYSVHYHYGKPYKHVRLSFCDRGGPTSAPGSIATLATSDSCNIKTFEKPYYYRH